MLGNLGISPYPTQKQQAGASAYTCEITIIIYMY